MFFVLRFHCNSVMTTRLMVQLEAFALTNCSLSGRSCFENRCARRVYCETRHDVLENWFLCFVTCSRKYQATFAIRVCLGVTYLLNDMHCAVSVIMRIS